MTVRPRSIVRVCWLSALVLVLVGCRAGVTRTSPLPTWPVAPERLPPATSGMSSEFGPASWALDPAFPSPTAGATELHILVWERSCSGGAPATGRISAPVVRFDSTAVTITIGVRPPDAVEGTAFGCPMPPGTPATMELSEPLGPRTLLDGGHVPPVPPSPANG